MQLTLMSFPQSWDGRAITLRILVLPRGNPFNPLIPGAPAFAAAALRLNAVVIPSLDRLPTALDALPPQELALQQPAQRTALFDKLRGSFEFDPAPPATNPRPAGTRIRKYLTESYRNAFRFERPRRSDFAGVDNSYECALTDSAIAEQPKQPPPGKQVRWGQVLSYVLRQPVLARELGLLYETSFNPPADAFTSGGWLYVELNPASSYGPEAAGDVKLVARYAARIPALAGERPLFAAVQFPVHSVPPPPFDPELLVDAQEYSDGFAKIVHGVQPKTASLLDDQAAQPAAAARRPVLSPSATPTAKEAGIKLGWDDEQISIWLNRLLVNDPEDPQHAPVAVSSYRVDVRRALGGDDWTSLHLVRGTVSLDGVVAGVFQGELGIEAVPVQLQGQKTGDFWLPSYFTTWAGASLALGDLQALDFALAPPERPPRIFTPLGLEAVPLLYGRDYEFRVRLADLSGGGPDAARNPVNVAPAPVATVAFRRYVRPKPVRVTAEANGTYSVLRPRLGYPEIAFTARPNFAHDLAVDIPSARAQQREPGLADPYVTTLRIDVSVRALTGDVASYSAVYTTTREFPDDPDAALAIELAFVDIADIAGFPAPAGAGPVAVPSARDVRISLTPVCGDPYTALFGDPDFAVGAVPYFINARRAPQDERALFMPGGAASQMQLIFMQPDPAPSATLAEQGSAAGKKAEVPSDIAARLAQQLGMALQGLTLVPPKGRRTIFGCSTRLPHTLAPDRSAVQFASRTDLQRIWIGVIRMRIARDWTWDALQPVSFRVMRILNGNTEEAGVIELPRTVSPSALANADRTGTEVVFLDAWDGKPEPEKPLREHNVTYKLEALFQDPPAQTEANPTWELRAPITTPPSQVPKLISAGIALSPYQPASDYSSTEPRARRLWLELSEPPADDTDLYFARVLAYSPDPVLMNPWESVPEPEEPPLPVDPELIRVIYPGQPADASGLVTMQGLEKARDSDKHYLLPLPPGVSEDAPELFGMWVYELRLGHDDRRWSTAQGRFGPPLRIAGVQHPAPSLSCAVLRRPATIEAAAPFASPVLNGRILRPRVPRTEMWLLLYAQVQQLDNKGWRNVLLRRTRAFPPGQDEHLQYGEELTLQALARFDIDTTWVMLSGLGLPRGTPLSILAVELIPANGGIQYPDPLGAHLGMVRVLRTSQLVAVPPVCT